MKRLFALLAAIFMSACATDGPQRYHVMAEHPFELRETAVAFDLTGKTGAELERLAAHAGASRPNNGSSFAVSADAMTGDAVRRVLLGTGVPPADILLIAPTGGARILRIDRKAFAANCTATPAPYFNPGKLDDGFGHENSNSALFGCAVRRNIAAMTEDPRTLFNADPASGRDGARGADVYARWSKGQSTESAGGPTSQPTSTSTLSIGVTQK
ncbi:MAG: CpaD family pilus assembly lipoprotein [Rhodospirillaceae bacterium]